MWWLAIILAGCEGTAQPPVECELMVDCGRGEACVSGRCVPIEDAGSQQPSDAEPIDGSTPDVGCNAIEIAGGTSHCTVQEAIDRAMPGDLLRVPAGRFDEAIVISTALTLEGTGAPTILRSISISAANVTVRSLHLESGDGVAIEVQQQGTVEDLEARGTALDGLVVRGSGIADLSGLRLIGMGAHVEAGSTATFSAAVIENAPGTGLLVDDGAVVVLGSASRVSGSTGAGIVVFAADFEMRDSQS